jgi:hypothetical protein
MTDRPILFSAPMVRALLARRKTQTRRVLSNSKPMSLFNGEWAAEYVLDPGNQSWRERELRFAAGDRLYVREAWRCHYTLNETAPRDLPPENSLVSYVADGDSAIHIRSAGRFRPGIHMPRWASRITLIVKDVRVQRLQDISEEDAQAECPPLDAGNRLHSTFRVAFANLWDGLNAARGYGWDANPWVAAYSFDVKLGSIDQIGGA